jgi:predicted DNA-binding protein (MmcQ/YjbR family)
MTLDTLRTHCLAKAGVTEEMPFGPTALVFKVMGKVFLLAGLDSRPLSFSVKCDPERAIDLREQYEAVRPGYHLNKKHWNTVLADGSVPDGTLKTWMDDSYALVVASLPRPLKAELALF